MMSEHLRRAEATFLEQYSDWLQMVQESMVQVTGFYREGFEENGDRLLDSTTRESSLFSSQTVTMAYLFGQEEEWKQDLEAFERATEEVRSLIEAETMSSAEKMRYVASVYMPVLKRWKLRVTALARK